MAFLLEGGLLVMAWLLGLGMDIAPFDTWRGSASALAIGSAAGALLLVPMSMLARSGWPPLRRLAEVVRQIADALFARATVLDLALVSLLAGVAEEALFRGVVQAGLAPAIGPVPAIAVGAVTFGLAHMITPTYAVVACGIGAAFGALLLATGDLAAPIAAHAVYDFLALMWVVKRGGPQAPPAEER